MKEKVQHVLLVQRRSKTENKGSSTGLGKEEGHFHNQKLLFKRMFEYNAAKSFAKGNGR